MQCQKKQASVVQRIGLRPTKPDIEVRILSGAQMEQWQMWSLRRTENPRELDRNQPAPQYGDDSSAGQNAGLWIRRSRVRSPFFTQTMEAWVSGRNHLSAKEAVLRDSKVRIFPFPQYARMVKWLTRRSAKPLSAGSNPAPGSQRELAQWSARMPYTHTVSGSSPEFPTNQEFYISLHPQN